MTNPDLPDRTPSHGGGGSEPTDPAMGRRSFVAAGASALAGLAAAGAPALTGLAFTRTQASAARAPVPGPPSARSRLILLGTAAGPIPQPNRSAPAQAIVVGDSTWVVDCGNGVARQMALAGLPLGTIRGVFITHHHSDHNADYGTLLLLAWAGGLDARVDTYGPPPLAEMTRHFLALSESDIRARMAEARRPPLAPLIAPHEIGGAEAGGTEAGGTEGGGGFGVAVYEDAGVRVSAVRVEHPPLATALAYRFDCPDRSIVISGDTRPSPALVALARGADVLVHEVLHVPAIEPLIARAPDPRALREHLLASHTTTEQVGRLATEAGVKTLVLTHLVPGGPQGPGDDAWAEAVRPHFKGTLVVGRDLLEL